MDTPILDTVAAALKDFRPRTQKEFVLLQIARRFNDEDLLAKYLNIRDRHSKRVLLEAARLAQNRADEERRPASVLFFELLEQFDRKGST